MKTISGHHDGFHGISRGEKSTCLTPFLAMRNVSMAFLLVRNLLDTISYQEKCRETMSGDQKSNCHSFWPPNIENHRKSSVENHQGLDDQAKLIYM